MMRSSAESSDVESVMEWFEERVEDGENGILVYPNLQTFRQICRQYVKDLLLVREEEEQHKENRMMVITIMIILITRIDVKHSY